MRSRAFPWRFLIFAVWALACTSAMAAKPDQDRVEALVESAMATWQVPGIAVGIVQGGETILAGGWGYRDIDRELPVTSRTTFGIGSNTKSFTALLAALLVADGRLDWEEPVHRYLPGFELNDPIAGRLATVPDLLSHMTGLPRHDGLWYGRSNSREDIFSRLRHLPPSTTFRATWQYNNLMYLTVGLVCERIGGKSWDALIAERILAPLDMASTVSLYRDQIRAPERALTYEMIVGELEAVPLRNVDNAGPAGSILSNVPDMLQYVAMMLADGKVDGEQVIPAAAVRAIRVPRVMMGVDIAAPDSPFPELGDRMYAMGLAKMAYRGKPLFFHGGGIDGYTSQMSWMPEIDAGVVVLTNSTSPASEIITYSLYDQLLGMPPIDWIGRMTPPGGAAPAPEAAAPKPPPAHALEAYVGQYEHAGYGIIEISKSSDGLWLRWDQNETSLTHAGFERFSSGPEASRWGIIPNLRSFSATFVTGGDGSIKRMDIPFEPAVAPIRFDRVQAE